MRQRILVGVIAAVIIGGVSLFAEEKSNAVSISAIGTAKSKPNQMKINLNATATAGGAADALSQCQAKVKSAIQLIKKLSIENLSVEEEMPIFTTPMSGNAYMGNPSVQTPLGTKVTSSILVKIADIQEKPMTDLSQAITKVMDAANKAGVGIIEPNQLQAVQGVTLNPVTFLADKKLSKSLREKALANAIAEAKSKKAALEKSGIKVGKLIGIKYGEVLANMENNPWQYLCSIQGTDPSQGNLTSVTPKEVTAQEKIVLVYQIKE